MSQFASKRLTIAKMTAKPSEMLAERSVYVAWDRSVEDPWPVCFCVVFEQFSWVDWIETREDARRRGFATELINAIEHETGEQLELQPVTELGELFCDAMGLRK